MKRKVFAIAMSVALLVALVPLFGGAVLADVDIVTEVPDVVGLSVAPGSIDFGIVNPGTSSTVDEALRTINLDNTGNCNLDVWTEITGEERVVEGELLGHGDGSQTVFGPTDYYPIIEDSMHVYLDGEMVSSNMYYLDKDNGLVDFGGGGTPMGPPAGGLLVSIDYNSKSTFYSGPEGQSTTGPFDSLYQGMTLNDASAPPEILAREYGRVLVDDQSCDPLAQIYVREDYPVSVETAQIIFWAEYKVPVNNPPVVEITVPTEGQDIDVGEVVTVTARITDDWGVPGAAYMIDDPMGTPTLMARVSGNACDGIYEAAWNTTGQSDGAHTVYVGCQDTGMLPGLDWVGVDLHVIIPAPVVTSITYTGDPDPAVGTVTITATATADPLSGGLVGGAYSIDSLLPGDFVPMTPDVTLPADAATFTGDWDSTAVADGDHTIYVGVTDALEQPGLGFLAIKVNNQGPVGWTYEVTYEDPQLGGTGIDVTTWTLAVAGVEPVTTPYFDGLCAKITTDYGDPPPVRFRATTMIVMYSSTAWVDVVTGKPVKAVAAIDLFGFVVTTYITYEWTGPDTYINHMVLDPPLSPPTNDTFEVVMTGVELVSVPAGDFMCAAMEHSVVASDAVPPTPMGLSKTDYLDTATPSTGLIKELDLSWDGDSTQVLVSVYDPGA